MKTLQRPPKEKNRSTPSIRTDDHLDVDDDYDDNYIDDDDINDDEKYKSSITLVGLSASRFVKITRIMNFNTF